MQAQDEQRPDPRAQAVRRIVADLLGEADAAEREQLAADLAADPSLAAERARLEATIGLVRDFAADARPETLPPEAAERLRQAVARGVPVFAGPGAPRRAWYATPVFRAAAGFALALGAFALWQGSQGAFLPAQLVATAESERASNEAPRSAQRPLDESEAAGITALRDDTAKGVQSDAPLGEPQPTITAGLSKDAAAATPAAEGLDLDAGVIDRLRGLGYDGGGPVPEVKLESRFGEKQADAESLGAPRQRSFADPATPGPGGPGAPVGGAPGAATAGEIYRGPGDSVPPGSVGGRFGGRTNLAESPAPSEVPAAKELRLRASSAESAPAAPGAASAAPAVTTGSDEFFLGRGEAEGRIDGLAFNDVLGGDEAVERVALERLHGLGYIGDDGEEDGQVPQVRAALRALGHGDPRYLRPLTHEERLGVIELMLADCRRRPSEHPRDMFYRWWGDNPFEYARTDALSTFAVDVDTASYTLARRYLVNGILPTKQQIRTEEFVNYFKGDVPAPTEETFAVAAELAPSPFNRSGDAWTLRVALRGREVTRRERQPLALTLVVDVSGSMQEQNRLELVKHALRLLVGELDARDSITVVAFSNEVRLVLPKTSARDRGLIESAIHPLAPQGGTNVQAGLRMGYEAALAGLDQKAHNRVVLLSDGVGNIGETDAAALNREVEHARERGVGLNTVGVGMGNHNDAFLEQLADKGDGLCNYIDDAREARRALVENFTGAFESIARDVKIQVEFDPAQVERYRLLGYENRAVADVDFRNDAVDAGEVGAGHQVVALYEVVRTGGGDGPLATVRVRWKPAGASIASNALEESPAREAAWTVDGGRAAGSFGAASAGFRRSVLVGQLAEVLRRSIHARDDSLESLLAEARKLAPELADPDFDEFVQMVERTIELIASDWGRYDDLARRLDQLRMQNYLKARLEGVARDLDRARVEELDGQIRELEAEIRRELEREPERFPKSKVR